MTLSHRSQVVRHARRVLALVVGAWMFAALAPCVMADSHCHDMAAATANSDHCGTAALDCQLPETGAPVFAQTDLPVPPAVLLTTLPVAPRAPLSHGWLTAATQHPPAPLHLRLERLLI